MSSSLFDDAFNSFNFFRVGIEQIPVEYLNLMKRNVKFLYEKANSFTYFKSLKSSLQCFYNS